MKWVLFFLVLQSEFIFASGTFIAPPPLPQNTVEEKVDCDDEKNKDKKECSRKKDR